MGRPKILLAEDHRMVAEGLGSMLGEGFELLGIVGDGRELIRRAEQLRPDLVIVDISMPRLNGLEAARLLKERLPETRILFLTVHSDPAYVAEAFMAGASGYVLKQAAASELIAGIRSVLKGRIFLCSQLARSHGAIRDGTAERRHLASTLDHRLTSRQREVLQLVAEGLSSKEIAEALNVSVKTVEFHRARIMSQLGLRTTAELTKYAVAHGITFLP